MTRGIILPLSYFLVAITYATVRYNIFGDVPWDSFPLFILNKAISLSAIMLLLHMLIRNMSCKEGNRRFCSVFLKVKISLHVLISVVLLGMDYYPKLMADGVLTAFGSISILGGIAAFVLIRDRVKIHNLAMIGLLMAHLFFLGFPGWLTPGQWHGSFPPISLLSFSLLCVIFAMGIFHQDKLVFSSGD